MLLKHAFLAIVSKNQKISRFARPCSPVGNSWRFSPSKMFLLKDLFDLSNGMWAGCLAANVRLFCVAFILKNQINQKQC